MLTVTWRRTARALLLCLYIDNCRDDAYRILSVVVRLPFTLHKDNLLSQVTTLSERRNRIGQHMLSTKFYGWLKYDLSAVDSDDGVQIELRGPEASVSVSTVEVLFMIMLQVRVRQLQVLGVYAADSPLVSTPLRPSPSHVLNFNPVQADAFALFQSIAAQVKYCCTEQTNVHEMAGVQR